MSTPARPGARPLAVPVTPPSLTRSSSPQIDHLFATLVEASFDLIEEIGNNIGHLSYLHVPRNDQPLLFLRKPQLHQLDPTETFRLMHTLTMLSNGRKPVAAFRHGNLSGHYNRTSGESSDGLFVFGPIQAPESASRMTAISRAFARVLHQFHLDDDELAYDHMATIQMEDVGTLRRATVSIPTDRGVVRGSGAANDAEHAVARAVIDASATGLTFDEVRRIDLGQRSAVLVVARDVGQVLRLGLAISQRDILHTVALAAMRACEQRP